MLVRVPDFKNKRNIGIKTFILMISAAFKCDAVLSDFEIFRLNQIRQPSVVIGLAAAQSSPVFTILKFELYSDPARRRTFGGVEHMSGDRRFLLVHNFSKRSM